MSEEFKELLEALAPEEEDITQYPAFVVIYKPDKIEVHLNKWEQLNPRRIEQAKVHIVAERDRHRIRTLREQRLKDASDE